MASTTTVDVMAERSLICRRQNGERFPVTLRVGKPYPASDVDWACPVEMAGLQSRLPDIHGIDSFQSLVLAQALIRSMLQHELDSGSTFHWSDTDEPMTMEHLFGKAI